MVSEFSGSMIGKVTLAGAGLLVVALATTACGGGQNTASGGSTSTTTSTTTQTMMTDTSGLATTPGNAGNPATAGGTGSGGSGGTGSGSGSGECKAATLRLSLGQGDAAMSHDYVPLQFTNTGKTSCVLVGFPGVSYVTGNSGQQVGAPAVRDGSIGPKVTLAPGQMASAIVTEVQVGVFDASVCKPTGVLGLRVYAPDDTASMFITQSTTGCAGNPPEPQLHVQTMKAGPGNQS